MRQISEQELKDILDKHGKWLRNESGGEAANLSHANLSHANLRYANLRYANLSHANLRYANLRYANLSHANLSYANLSHANLSYANLRYANLRYANLSHANLSYANLSYANLRSVIGFKFTPLQVVNTKYFITIFDDHVLWGCKKLTFDEVKKFAFTDCTDTSWKPDEFKLNKKIITEMIRYYRN
jgi:uncharacterized protein YjbI with pentapeptide repeats